jgi:pilus assembly protein CpaE
MKIVVISPNPDHLAAITGVLQAQGHEVCTYAGGKTRMLDLAERELPQLMVVDGLCCDPGELTHVERVSDRQPHLAIVLLCPSHTAEFLMQAMRAGVREVLPSPPSAAALEAAVARAQSRQSGPSGRPTGQVLAFLGCKGGSGATFLATNVAAQLAREREVLLVDLDLQFGDALSYLHDGRPPATLADVARVTARLDASLLQAGIVKVAPRLGVLAAPDDPAQALEITAEQVDAVLTEAVALHDFVVLDLPRRLDPLALLALDRAARVHLVLQPALPDLRHAARLLQAFRSLGYAAGKVHVVLNRFERDARIGLEQVQRTLGAVPLRTIGGAWREVQASIDHGETLAEQGRAASVARQVAALANDLLPQPAAGRGFFDRILRRA